MKKVLLINGSPREHGCTDAALKEVAEELRRCGVESELLWMGKEPMQDCVACFSCSKTGRCVCDDLVNVYTSRLDEFGGIVVGSPVYYSGPTGRVTSFLDRFFMVADKSKLARKCGAAVVSCRRGGASASFDRLNKYFQITNMNVIGSQYWNQVHGSKAEQVREDEEGMQTMRTLARNMAWMMKAQEMAETGGLEPAVYEKSVKTNFIR